MDVSHLFLIVESNQVRLGKDALTQVNSREEDEGELTDT